TTRPKSASSAPLLENGAALTRSASVAPDRNKASPELAEYCPFSSQEAVMDHREAIVALRQFLSSQIFGQERLIERLLIALLADGHMLVEGAPGLAKTRAIKELAGSLEAEFHRIQFTPDLLPADITGTEIYRPETGSFVFQQGPIFHNLVLADEINRAPAK